MTPTKQRKWTRKGNCPHCNNRTGSLHKKICPLAYADIGKMKKPTKKDKLKQAIIKLIIKL